MCICNRLFFKYWQNHDNSIVIFFYDEKNQPDTTYSSFMEIVSNVFVYMYGRKRKRKRRFCYFFCKLWTTKTHLFSWVTHCFYLILMINKQTSYYYFRSYTVGFGEDYTTICHFLYAQIVRHNGLFWLRIGVERFCKHCCGLIMRQHISRKKNM